jgi:hypothetical protein
LHTVNVLKRITVGLGKNVEEWSLTHSLLLEHLQIHGSCGSLCQGTHMHGVVSDWCWSKIGYGLLGGEFPRRNKLCSWDCLVGIITSVGVSFVCPVFRVQSLRIFADPKVVRETFAVADLAHERTARHGSIWIQRGYLDDSDGKKLRILVASRGAPFSWSSCCSTSSWWLGITEATEITENRCYRRIPQDEPKCICWSKSIQNQNKWI